MLRPEPSRAPVDLGIRAAADAGVIGPRRQLLQPRVAGHRSGQLAGQARVGSAWLHAVRRAAALAIAAIDFRASMGAAGDTHDGIEPAPFPAGNATFRDPIRHSWLQDSDRGLGWHPYRILKTPNTAYSHPRMSLKNER